MEEAWRRCRGKWKEADAVASVALNPDEGGYFGEQLQEVYGIPYIDVYDSLPIAKTYVGIKGALSLAEDYIHFVRKMNKTKGVTFEISEFAAGINTIDASTTGQLDFGNFADYAGINWIA